VIATRSGVVSTEVPTKEVSIVSAITGLPALAAPASEKWVFLTGRPPASEFVHYVKLNTVGGTARDMSELMDIWRTANDRIQELERDDAGAADHTQSEPLPADMVPFADRVLGDPIVPSAFGAVPSGLGWVELDRLVVFQKHINLRYVEELRAQLGDTPTPEELFKFALPYDHPVPPVLTATATNGWVLTSPSADFRVLGAESLDPSRVTGLQLNGTPAAVLAVLVGHGSNYLNVVSAEGRLILNNGSHRAYALREAGYTHAPAIVQNVTRRDELELVSEEVHKNADRYFVAGRPPMLKDYFEPQLRQVLLRPRLAMQVQVGISVQPMMVPLQ